MNTDTYTEQINVSNILTLNFTYIEEKLKRNFQIIAKRLTKLEALFSVEDRIKGIQRQSKFLSMKLQNVILKLPEVSMGVSSDSVKQICQEEFGQYMNRTHDNLKTTRFYHQIKDAVIRGLRDENKIPPPVTLPSTPRKSPKKKDHNQKHQKLQSLIEKNPLIDIINKQQATKDMTKQERHFADKILSQQKSIEQLLLEVAVKLKIFMRDYQQTRISKGSLQSINKNLEKYDKLETYESKYRQNNKKTMEKQKITRTKIQRVRDIQQYNRDQIDSIQRSKQLGSKREQKTMIKFQRTDSFARIHNKSQETLIDNAKINTAYHLQEQQTKLDQLKLSKKKSLMEEIAPNNFIPTSGQKSSNYHNNVETKKKEYRSTEKRNSRKSLTKVFTPENAIRQIDNNQDMILAIKQLERSLDQKVNKDVFINVVQELEEKVQALRHARDISDTAQVKKFCMSMQNRMQAVISFVQQLQDDQDPLIAKKKWSCMSCDKHAQKYTAKVGPHLSWESLGGKKLSPVKAGSFGQTVLIAGRVKNLLDIKDIPQQ